MIFPGFSSRRLLTSTEYSQNHSTDTRPKSMASQDFEDTSTDYIYIMQHDDKGKLDAFHSCMPVVILHTEIYIVDLNIHNSLSEHIPKPTKMAAYYFSIDLKTYCQKANGTV